jgi:hypothetical protein
MQMTKRAVKEALGITSDAELGRVFNLSRRAPHLWPDDEPIPELRQLQLQVMRPEIFGGPQDAKKKAS